LARFSSLFAKVVHASFVPELRALKEHNGGIGTRHEIMCEEKNRAYSSKMLEQDGALW
jgi:hypothetical protein